MTVGKFSLAFFLAVLMAVFSPGVLRMTMAATAEQAAPVVPMGEELNEDQLLEAEGEFWWLVKPFVVGGITWVVTYFASDRCWETATLVALGAMIIACLP